jgi:hypothetical protein
MNVEDKLDLEKIIHLNQVWCLLKNGIVLVLTTEAINCDGQDLSWVVLAYPELIMEVLHDERGSIVASLLPSKIHVPITVELVRLINLTGLFTTILWQRHVSCIVANNDKVVIIVAILLGRFSCHLNVVVHSFGLRDV